MIMKVDMERKSKLPSFLVRWVINFLNVMFLHGKVSVLIFFVKIFLYLKHLCKNEPNRLDQSHFI